MGYEYNALRGRIVEKFGSQKQFAEELNVSSQAVSNKMCGRAGFNQKDIERWCEMLDIEQGQIEHYFFT